MKICKLTIENLNSLRLKKTIDFGASPLSDTGLFAITGDTGAGKSTLLDAITLALYGRIHRNDKPEEVLSYGAAKCLAEVEFETPAGRYRAKWSLWRAHHNLEGAIQPSVRELSQWDPEVEEFRPIAQKKREVDQLVESITGLDYDRFTRSVLLSQGDFAAFLRSGERERSDLLERITGTEVYSRLSQAAYQRFRLEEETLEKLKQELVGLRVLEPGARQAIEQRLEEHETRIGEEKKKLTDIRSALDWRLQLRRLEERRTDLRQRLEALEVERKDAEPALERLERHRKTLPLQAPLARLADMEARRTKLDKQSDELAEEGDSLQSRTEEARAAHAGAVETAAAIREELSGLRLVIDQVVTLDVAIKEKKVPLEKQEATLAETETRIVEQQESLAALEQEARALAKEKQKAEDWLKEHAPWKALIEEYGRIEYKADELRTVLRRRNELEQETKEKARLLKKEKKALEKLEEQQQTEQARTDELLADFRETVPEQLPQNRSDLLDLLHRQLTELGERRRKLQQLKQLSDDYEGALAVLEKCDEQLESLQNEEVELSKHLMNSLEQLDLLDKEKEKRKSLYRREQQIANYAKDRADLKDGEACPLCFSEHHPFREKEIEPFVDETREDLERAERRFDGALREQKKLTLRLQELTVELRQLHEQRQTHYDRTLVLEDRMVEVAREGLDGEEFALARSLNLEKRLREAAQMVEVKNKARERLTDLNRRLEQQEARLQKVKQDLQQKEQAIHRLDDQLELLNRQLSSVRKDFAERSEQITALLQPFGHEFSVETARETLNDLRGNRDDYQARSKTYEATLARQKEVEREKERLGAELADGKENRARQRRDYQLASQEVAQMEARRRELFGEKDPQAERTGLEEKARAAEERGAGLQKEWQEVNGLLESNRKLREQLTTDRREVETAITELTEQLEVKARKEGFESLEAVREIRLAESEEKELRQLEKDLEERILKTRQSLQDADAEWEALQKQERTGESEERLRGRLEEAETDLQTLQEARGAMRQQLKEDEERQREAAGKMKQIEEQQREYNRWARLSELIGSADGKKFRTFAQGLTLRRLTQLANRHLRQLNGRYLIEKRTDDDLALEIIDTFQADNRRSMNTLSGGESFLVSLALALGLSDLAGRDAQIKSLFIDEGFGTLDDNSLDLAISTLENLQAGGKTIGIISHVKELKERIATQVRIRKLGNGFSEVEVS